MGHPKHFPELTDAVEECNSVPQLLQVNNLILNERGALVAIAPLLMDVQAGRCFYCSVPIKKGEVEVDHFVPWSRYPVGLGNNFVAADRRCNSAKSDFLPAEEHLERWAGLQKSHGTALVGVFEKLGLSGSLEVSLSITTWAYEQTFAAQGKTWVRGKELCVLSGRWQERLAALALEPRPARPL